MTTSSASPSTLSCDPVYRSLVRAALAGDEAALGACSDYREERGLPRLHRGLASAMFSAISYASDTAPDLDELEARCQHVAYERSFLGRCDVRGCRWTLKELAEGITRQRGRSGARSPKMAARLREALDRLADQRWARAVKGQRRPTPRAKEYLCAEIESTLDTAQRRCKERLLDSADVIACAVRAIDERTASADGGRPWSNSYGYAYSTTCCYAERRADGTIAVSIWRDGPRLTFTAPARHWQSMAELARA